MTNEEPILADMIRARIARRNDLLVQGTMDESMIDIQLHTEGYYSFPDWKARQTSIDAQQGVKYSGWCMQCRAKQGIKNAVVSLRSNARNSQRQFASGFCEGCGRRISTLVRSDKK